MTRAGWFVSVGLAFAVHNGEEALTAATMLNMLQQRAPGAVRELYLGVSKGELQAVLLVLSLAGIVLSLAAYRRSTRPAATFAMLVFAAVLGLNACAHIGLSLVSTGYVPGIVTSLFLTLPLAILLFRQAVRDGWVSRRVLYAAVPAALVVHGPILVAFIWTSVNVLRAFRGPA